MHIWHETRHTDSWLPCKIKINLDTNLIIFEFRILIKKFNFEFENYFDF